jgi:hypothetical protein
MGFCNKKVNAGRSLLKMCEQQKPNVFNDGTVAFLMRQKLTHHNLQSNPRASFLFTKAAPDTTD